MLSDPRACLWDAREGADAITSFVGGTDAESYAGSELVRSAMKREFEIIGDR